MELFALEVFLAFSLVSFVSSCKCPDRSHWTIPDIYYKATYIVKIRIEGKEAISDPSEPTRGVWRYTISTTEKYKVCGEYDAVADKTSLYTPQDSAACGISLDVGSTYIIAGSEGDGQLTIARCNLLYEPVEEFAYDELTYLKNEYAKGCPNCNQGRGEVKAGPSQMENVGPCQKENVRPGQKENVSPTQLENGQARGVYPAWVLVVFLMSMAIYQQTSQLVS